MVHVANSSDEFEQWDVLTSIRELESLEIAVERFIQHTMRPFGRDHGMDLATGQTVIEHPMGQALYVVQQMKKGCEAKYGRDMLDDARGMDGAIIVRDDSNEPS